MDSGCLATSRRCGVPAKTGGEPCGDAKHESVCLGCLEREDVKYIVIKCYCVIRPANIWNPIYVNYSYPEM